MNYYRCEKGTEAYQILSELYNKEADCIHAAAELASELGAISFTLNSLVVGGIGSLRFISKPDPKKYKVIGVKRVTRMKFYDCIPNIDTEEGAKIAVKITKLPFIRMEEVDRLLCITDKVDETGDSFGFDLMPVGDWFYLKSEVHHGLNGLEEITEDSYASAETYIRSKR